VPVSEQSRSISIVCVLTIVKMTVYRPTTYPVAVLAHKIWGGTAPMASAVASL